MCEAFGVHRERFPGKDFDREYLMPHPGAYLDESVDLARRKTDEFFAYRDAWCRATATIEADLGVAEAVNEFRIQ